MHQAGSPKLSHQLRELGFENSEWRLSRPRCSVIPGLAGAIGLPHVRGPRSRFGRFGLEDEAARAAGAFFGWLSALI